MDTFLIFAWDVGSQKLVESCLHHEQMVSSEATHPRIPNDMGHSSVETRRCHKALPIRAP